MQPTSNSNHVSWLVQVRFLVHMQKEESKMNIAGTA